MAFREVRVYFYVQDETWKLSLNKELWSTFTFYMDVVMRGRFREYSGAEVKGVNIVNLYLYEESVLRESLDTNCSRPVWRAWLNMYEFHVLFDYSKLTGTTEEKLRLLINTFIKFGRKSKLPQMKRLIDHIIESRGKIDLKSVFDKATDYRRSLGIKD